jgi:predicted PurR-regulated permease PerM
MSDAVPPPTPAPRTGGTDWSSIVRKLMIWGVFGGMLYLLRGFFLLVLLTFVFAYCAEQVIRFLGARVRNVSRPVLVCAVFGIGIAALVGLGFITVPAVEAEAARVKVRLPEYRGQIAHKYDEFQDAYPALARSFESAFHNLETLRREFFASPVESQPESMPSDDSSSLAHETGIAFAADFVLRSVNSVVSAVFTVALSLLFAFLILVDLSTIREETERLRTSRIGWIYEEVRSTVIEFSASVGWILEAQILISAINTILTITGLWLLGIPSLLLLAVILFFCGLVPVLGALVPLLPIALVAFAEGGMSLLVKCLAFIVVERVFVGYAVEPRIFGKRFHMNPVFVLVILFVGYQVAGIWGVVLGLPVAYTALRPRGGVVVPGPSHS